MPLTPLTQSLHERAKATVARSPIFAVVRTGDPAEAMRQATTFIEGGLELIEITFSVPGATELVQSLIAARAEEASYMVGMGTVTTKARAEEAVAAGAEFIVAPNTSQTVAKVAIDSNVYLLLGAVTPTEIVTATELGADLVKVYPLPPIGGPAYLNIVRQPLGDIPMLAGGGFPVSEIPEYLAAGASAFGIGSPLLGKDAEESNIIIAQALQFARG